MNEWCIAYKVEVPYLSPKDLSLIYAVAVES